jgi:hypothetical protein
MHSKVSVTSGLDRTEEKSGSGSRTLGLVSWNKTERLKGEFAKFIIGTGGSSIRWDLDAKKQIPIPKKHIVDIKRIDQGT